MSTKAIEQFLKRPDEGGAYTDERLAMLLAHAQDGKLSFLSCCCVAGIPTANHALRGLSMSREHENLGTAQQIEVSDEFCRLGDNHDGLYAFQSDEEDDAVRRAKLIPLILAEMERREGLKPVTRELRDNNHTQEECFVPASH